MQSGLSLALLALVTGTGCVNFAYESIQLSEKDVGNFSAIAFGDKSVRPTFPACKALPDTPEWPGEDEWSRLNGTMGGALLKPVPVAAACYEGPYKDASKCNYLLTTAKDGRFYLDDPLTVLTMWPQGNTCRLELRPTGNCTQGGYPSYVVNVTTVQQVQAAVNFARNNNIRLVIKNTGHDFVGKSTGAGAISVFTHWLKNFEFLPDYSIGQYRGMAARVGAGLEAWELYEYMAQYNMSIVVPAGYTVGPFGGWIQGGGHSNLGSVWGLGSDQVLSLQVVTADGKLVTADPNTNKDLFYALRGGGPSTFGIVTSAIVKAHPPIQVPASALNFKTSNETSLEDFWLAVDAFFYYTKFVCDAGGSAYSYVSPSGNDSFTFTNDFEMPGVSNKDMFDFLGPLYDYVNSLGFKVEQLQPSPSTRWGPGRRGLGDSPGDSRFASRLFPQKNWDDDDLFEATMAAIRESVEAGYRFHGVHLSPTEAVAGWPGVDSGVNPAFRTTYMHADVFDTVVPKASAEATKVSMSQLNAIMDKIRVVTPGGGAYVNEADRNEPNWQQSFWGDKYPRLLRIKKEVDPWGLFWAPTTPGSEAWEVRTADGLPTQNGPLCRVVDGV